MYHNINVTVIILHLTAIILGKYSRGEVWRTDSFRVFGKRKFGELIDPAIGY